MRRFFASALVNTLIACVAAADANEAGATLKQVITLGVPGLQYPSEFLGFQTEMPEPIGRESSITPTGLRQYYMVGNEWRARYVTDVPLLTSEYTMSQNQLQSAFRGANIQSLEASMMGLYPGSQLNDLNLFQ